MFDKAMDKEGKGSRKKQPWKPGYPWEHYRCGPWGLGRMRRHLRGHGHPRGGVAEEVEHAPRWGDAFPNMHRQDALRPIWVLGLEAEENVCRAFAHEEFLELLIVAIDLKALVNILEGEIGVLKDAVVHKPVGHVPEARVRHRGQTALGLAHGHNQVLQTNLWGT